MGQRVEGGRGLVAKAGCAWRELGLRKGKRELGQAMVLGHGSEGREEF